MIKKPKIPVETAAVKRRKLPVTGTSKRAVDVTMAEDPTSTYYHRTTIADWLAMSAAASRSIISEFDLLKLGSTGVTKNAIHNLASSFQYRNKP
jgi:hypothetical protein